MFYNFSVIKFASFIDIGLPDTGSGAYECRETHNESCFLCPYNKAPSIKTCTTSDTGKCALNYFIVIS